MHFIFQAGFTLGLLIVSAMGLLTLYCCYRVLKSPKSIRKFKLHSAFSMGLKHRLKPAGFHSYTCAMIITEHTHTHTSSTRWTSKCIKQKLDIFLFLCFGNFLAYEDTSDWEFPDVCKYYFGKIGQLSSLVFSLVSLIGAMVVYWVLMSNFLYNTGKFIYSTFMPWCTLSMISQIMWAATKHSILIFLLTIDFELNLTFRLWA